MKRLSTIIIITVLVQIGSAQTGAINYFGQIPPGNTPVVFAPGIVSLDNRFEFGAAFSKDGEEFCFSVTTSGWSSFRIYYSKHDDGYWTNPDTISFSTDRDLSPVFSSDGQSLMFSRQTDIYRVNRYESNWSNPIKVPAPISSNFDEWTVRISDNGSLYFSSTRTGGEDIFRSKFMNGQYLSVENLGNIINSDFSEDGPCIAPDESYLIFTSRKPGGYGNRDLYISFQKDDNTWTSPINLGPIINKNCFNFSPYLSPDGKYLFFSRRYHWDSMDIYWVNTHFIEGLREKTKQ